jgi:phosphatidylserine/phosphatidylglycerophosphate/cardiolipin synthase-like enzyme
MSRNSYAYAITNNSICYIRWHFAEKIPGCLGFSIHRVAVSQTSQRPEWEGPLPATVGFVDSAGEERSESNTDLWPVQKFEWRDTSAPTSEAIKYRIIPMRGVAGNLRGDQAQALETNPVTLTGEFGAVHVTFLRGIIDARPLIPPNENKPGKGASPGQLHRRIQTFHDPLREQLARGANHIICLFVEQAQTGGRILAALHEVTDGELIEMLTHLGSKVEMILSNADGHEEYTDEKRRRKTRRISDKLNAKVRRHLARNSQVKLTNRFLDKGAVGHNKFLIYMDEQGVPSAVLSGSTDWTPFGLCAQTNNIIILKSRDIALQYYEYWRRLKQDAEKPRSASHRELNAPATPLQPALRSENGQPPLPVSIGGGELKVWFSPNARLKITPSRTLPAPPDLEEVLSLMSRAQKSILFLMFRPGTPSIAQHIRQMQRERLRTGRPIYIAGAATDPTAEGQFVEVFLRGASHLLQGPARARVSSREPADDEFSRWQVEMYQLGHSVIHDRIVVIDHCDPQNCVVITGSHSLNYRASCCNDENLIVIKGVQEIAFAYAAHVMDVSDHFRWRWCLQQDAKRPLSKRGKVWAGLSPSDGWQDKYYDSTHPASHDAKFLQLCQPENSSRT